MPELNPFKIAQAQLDEAAAKLGLDEATHELLRWPQLEMKVTLPVEMDDGKVKIFHGYRVQYNSARGPTKGGLRWHPDETHRHRPGAGRLDDLEDRGGGHPPGRRQRAESPATPRRCPSGKSSASPGRTCGPWPGSFPSPRTCPPPTCTPPLRSWPG